MAINPLTFSGNHPHLDYATPIQTQKRQNDLGRRLCLEERAYEAELKGLTVYDIYSGEGNPANASRKTIRLVATSDLSCFSFLTSELTTKMKQ